MGVKGSGELRFPDHSNESTGQDITEEFGPDGSGQVSLKDYYKGGSRVPNITANSNVPDGSSGNTEISLKDFYGAADLSFDGNSAGQTGSFSFTSGVKPAGSRNVGDSFEVDINGTERSSGFWEMQHSQTVQPLQGIEASANAIFRIFNDTNNSRIGIILQKDGDSQNFTGTDAGLNVNTGGNTGWKFLPYVGLENATWTYKIEYDTTSSGYDSTNDFIFTGHGTGNFGNNNMTFTSSATFISITGGGTSTNVGTFRAIPTQAGLANNGIGINDISFGTTGTSFWECVIPNNNSNNNSSATIGGGSSGLSTTGCRVHIKAVNGSETFQSISNYWSIGLLARRTSGGGL